MSIKETLERDLLEAMRNRIPKRTIRMAIAAIKSAELIEGRRWMARGSDNPAKEIKDPRGEVKVLKSRAE